MKLRTCVLASALLIVPLVAMFSHLVPADVRRMARAGLWQPVEDAALSLLGGDTDQPLPGTLVDVREPPPPRTLETVSPWPSSPAGDAPHGPGSTPAAAAPPPVAQASFDTPPAPAQPIAAETPSPALRRPASPQAVADALVASTRGDWTSHVRGVPAGGVTAPGPGPTAPAALPASPRTAPPVVPGSAPATTPERAGVERELADLGAIGFEFVPADAGCPRHRCSCRLPADPSGQLQRVFQAADEDPRAALGQLLAEVKAWQRRAVALGPPAAGAASSVDGVRR